MSKHKVIGLVITLGIMGAIFAGSYVLEFFYVNTTKHDVTVTIESLDKVPTKEKDGSNYLVYTKENRMIELQRGWFQFSNNIDLLYKDIESKKGQTVTFECYGWYMPEFYWYDMCYKVK